MPTNYDIAIERSNYYRDRRNRSKSEIPDGLPTRWVVCPVCNGEGKHVNPSIDASGLSPEVFADDPDFADDYFSGRYDIQCNYCHGRTTVQDIDRNALSDEQLGELEAEEAAEASYQAQVLAELRNGC